MIDGKDIQWDEYTNATRNVGMKLTHIPTGLHVKGSSEYRYRLREQLLTELEQLINNNDRKSKRT